MANTRKHTLKVIKGGMTSPRQPTYEFVAAFVTNTRLMGVEVLYIHWQEKEGYLDDFHQFFYFDGEEYGLENYVSYKGTDPLEIASIERLLTGGLGGEKSAVSEDESRFLIQDYLRASKRLGVELPEGHQEFSFLLTPEIELSQKDRKVLYKKECASMENEYQPIHYFLMRVFAKDFEFANYLSDWQLEEVNLYPELKPSTLVKNTIELVHGEYLCESLIDFDGQYYIAVSEISLTNKQVFRFRRHKLFQITHYEAGLLINRTEYIACYDFYKDYDHITDGMPIFDGHAYMTSYDKGKLFMLYNSNNDHVKNPVFKIHEDVYGSYFISYFGQVLVSSFLRNNLALMEKRIAKSETGTKLLPQGRFEFKEPVLYEYIQDEIEDFLDFIDFYKE